MRQGQASWTAKMVAYWRAFADMGVTTVPRFSDPFARKLLDGVFWSRSLRWAEGVARDPRPQARAGILPWVDGLMLRVSFIDSVLADSGIRQVVNLGAGLDTRAWRLEALRGARVFEVDHPATQAYKQAHAPALGAPLAELTYVPVDFERDDLERALASAGHDRTQPTAWIWEGVTMYLGDAPLRRTLEQVRRLSAPESRLIAHYHEPEAGVRAQVFRRAFFAWLGEPQIGQRTRDVMRAELTRAGFEVLEDAGLPEQAARAGGGLHESRKLQVSRVMVAR